MNQLATINDNELLKPNALEVHENELFNTVNACIAKCYADLNLKVPADPAYLVNEVTKSILERYPTLRLTEIPKAFANGIRNAYGEYFGLSVISFEQFIKGYLESPERAKLVHEKNRLVIDEKTEPTSDEKFDTAKGLCVGTYERVIANKAIGLNAVTVYTFLNSLKVIPPEYKTDVMKQALAELVKEKQLEIALCGQLLKRRRLNAELEMLTQNIANDGITAEQYNEQKRVAKRIVLTNFLRDMAMNNDDLSELIETKRNEYTSSK